MTDQTTTPAADMAAGSAADAAPPPPARFDTLPLDPKILAAIAYPTMTPIQAKAIPIVLAGRDPAKAQSILDAIDPASEHHAVDIAHFSDPTDFAFDDRQGCFDLVVNASPLGMRGQPPLAFDWSHAPPGAIAYDIVTDPLETEFLRNAGAAGHQTIDGLAMLIGQAAFAFEKFFGVAPPREHDGELRAMLSA